MKPAEQIEAARARLRERAIAGELEVDPLTLERDFWCELSPALVALVKELAPLVAKWARSKVPGWIRWALGGLVENVATSALVDAVEDWKETQCEGNE